MPHWSTIRIGRIHPKNGDKKKGNEMQPPPNKWPDSDYARHALFIAQTILESLGERNFESFRSQALDNLERLKELYRSVSANFSSAKPQTNFSPMIDELKLNVPGSTIHQIAPVEISIFLHEMDSVDFQNKSSLKQFRLRLRIIIQTVEGFYLESLKRRIHDHFKDCREKISAQNTIREFISLLINSGYNKDFIRTYCNECFFSKDIKRYNSNITSKFLNRFDDSDRTYQVYIPIQKQNFPFFQELIIGKFLKWDELPVRLRNIISKDPAYSENDRFYQSTAIQKDGHSAVARRMSAITRRAATSIIFDKGFIPKARHYAFVKRKGTDVYRATLNPDRHIQEAHSSITLKQAKRLVLASNELTTSFSSTSVKRIISANEIVALIRTSENSETQISLIWSAFEALIGDPLDSSSRIRHFIANIAPCVCLNYPWRYSEAIFHQLQIHHRKALEAVLDDTIVDASIPQLQRFQNFIFDPTFSPNHRDLLAKLTTNPALQFHIFMMFRSFSTPKAAKKRWEEHEERVKWQLQRIYRMRNDFIHAGKRSKPNRAVALNCYEYYRTLVAAISFKASKLVNENFISHDESTIDYTIEALKFEYLIRKERLSTMISEKKNSFKDDMTFFRRV